MRPKDKPQRPRPNHRTWDWEREQIQRARPHPKAEIKPTRLRSNRWGWNWGPDQTLEAGTKTLKAKTEDETKTAVKQAYDFQFLTISATLSCLQLFFWVSHNFLSSPKAQTKSSRLKPRMRPNPLRHRLRTRLNPNHGGQHWGRDEKLATNIQTKIMALRLYHLNISAFLIHRLILKIITKWN